MFHLLTGTATVHLPTGTARVKPTATVRHTGTATVPPTATVRRTEVTTAPFITAHRRNGNCDFWVRVTAADTTIGCVASPEVAPSGRQVCHGQRPGPLCGNSEPARVFVLTAHGDDGAAEAVHHLVTLDSPREDRAQTYWEADNSLAHFALGRRRRQDPASVISTRRFCARPCAVSFGAIGSVSPYPRALTRSDFTPCETIYCITALARFSDSI